MAPTNDEDDHIGYGAAILRGSADRSSFAYDSKMPVTVLNAIPGSLARFLESRGMGSTLAEKLRDIRVARCATVFAAFGLCLLVYFYAASLYGRTAGLFAQLLFVLSPNIGAHSALATTDLYAACGFVLFLYCLHRFLERPSSSRAAMAAAALALAQLTKFAAICLYPVLVLVLLALAFSRKLGWHSIIQLLAFHAFFFLAFVNAGFLFDRTLTPLEKYEFRGATFQALARIPGLRAIPLPVPYPYIQGFDMMKFGNDTGDGNIMLLGEVRGKKQARSGGFPSYYLVCYALKEPLGMQLLLLLAIFWIVRHRRWGDFLAAEFPLLASAGLLTLWLSLASRTQIGIRHILPALAVFVILSGAAFAGWEQFGPRRRLLLTACLLYVAVSVGSYFPHLIPYFNEMVADRKMAYRYLADSNLDWGQDRWVVDAFHKKNGEVRLNPERPVLGSILVSANVMAGIGPYGVDYWVRRLGLMPVAHVGYGHLLFRVTPERCGTCLSAPPGAIAVTGATPRRGAAPAGTSQALTFTLTDSRGTADLAVVDVLINNRVDGRNACYLAYVPSSDTLVLVNDAGDAGGPHAGAMALNRPAGSIQNSQCIVSSAIVNSAGSTLTMTLNVRFQASFKGNRTVYASAQDHAGATTGWQAVATWMVE